MKTRLIHTTAFTLCIVWAISASALSLIGGKKEEPLLEPAQAFLTRVQLDDQQHLNVEINIAPGYFVYRSKIKVESEQAEFGPLDLPDGEKKQDQFFGEVETYRDLLTYKTLLSTEKTGPLKINVWSQGCADVGICYPPYSKEFTVEVPANSAGNKIKVSQADATGSDVTVSQLENPLLQNRQNNGLQDGLIPNQQNELGTGLGLNTGTSTSSTAMMSSAGNTALGGGSSLSDMLSIESEDEVLDPEVAFTLDPVNISKGVARFKWNIAEGHYLYKKRFSFELISPDNANAANPVMTAGLWEEDAFFGKSEVYRNSATVELPVSLPANAKEALIKVGYQGCADIGICYPPIFKEVKITGMPTTATLASTDTSGTSQNPIANSGNTTLANSSASAVTANNTLALQTATANEPIIQNEQDRLADSLKGGNKWLTIATFFGMGLLLTFTPCVLPMIPILSSIIVGSGENTSTGRAFVLSLVYVLAMALTYTIAGVLVGLSGENIQATLQHPYVLTAFALLFVLLSLSMFGFYELQMPQFIQNRLTSVSNKQKSGSFGGVATMGFLSALIVGPCVTAPLVGALIYIGQTGDAVLGGAALFALSMGMGLPLLIIGTTFGKYLPRAGAWMDITKAIFGVMLLGLAIYMLDRVIPAWATMLLSAILLITVAMFMGVFDSLASDAAGWRRVSKGLGFTALVYGTLLMVGVATGTGTLFRPMQGLSIAGNSSQSDAQEHVTFQTVKSLDQLNTRLAEARASNTPVMFDFYADWCISCKEMEAFTFTDQKVAAKMKQGLLLQADVTANDEQDKELLKEFGIFGPPAIIFYDANGVEQKNARVVGFMSAEKFGAVLDRVF